eukprot:4612525-Pyramimonas_sp.AAC.1
MLAKKIHPLNPEFSHWIKNDYFLNQHHSPTAGFIGTMVLLHTCEQVTLYGFNLRSGTEHELKEWYFPKKARSPRKGFEMSTQHHHVVGWQYVSNRWNGNDGGGGGGAKTP